VAASPDRFRELMRRWTSGVTVVTCRRDGHVHGMTASSFTGVSLEPPLVLVCVNRANPVEQALRGQGVFGVQILAEGMEEVSDRCAGRRGDEGHRLDDLPVHEAVTGAPILSRGLAWFDCRMLQALEAGDHTILLARVEAGDASEGAPLVYWDRGYHSLERVEEPTSS
jgi:flavin reductase (DIM6/NTAB) family NADH-FMN oxidoreductase RutF